METANKSETFDTIYIFSHKHLRILENILSFKLCFAHNLLVHNSFRSNICMSHTNEARKRVGFKNFWTSLLDFFDFRIPAFLKAHWVHFSIMLFHQLFKFKGEHVSIIPLFLLVIQHHHLCSSLIQIGLGTL